MAFPGTEKTAVRFRIELFGLLHRLSTVLKGPEAVSVLFKRHKGAPCLVDLMVALCVRPLVHKVTLHATTPAIPCMLLQDSKQSVYYWGGRQRPYLYSRRVLRHRA